MALNARPTHVWVDGEILTADSYHISVFDRGFQLGDAVYETLRAHDGRVMEFSEHLARLLRSAAVFEIVLPTTIRSQLGTAIRSLLEVDGLDESGCDASIRITISRGSTYTRDLLPSANSCLPTVVIQASRMSSAGIRGGIRSVQVVVSGVRRDPQNPLTAIRTTSRIERIHALLEARRSGADEAIFLTVDGHLSEATSANIFIVRHGGDGKLELATPSLDCAILDGITRRWLLGWARGVGIRPIQGRFSPDDLSASDESFLTSSIAGIVPIVGFEGQPIGTGTPGPWALRARADREASFDRRTATVAG